MHKQLEAIMQKEMSRKEFLATLGFGVASVFGFSSVLRLLNGKSHVGQVTRGYGNSAYGGGRD
ncbi:MAG TPA: hypothetical protein VLF91_01655 [Candidatus Saccharimonadales bacterium]|nr:hypothetical protein [Candidatus Saccharimonadales bacterium]